MRIRLIQQLFNIIYLHPWEVVGRPRKLPFSGMGRLTGVASSYPVTDYQNQNSDPAFGSNSQVAISQSRLHNSEYPSPPSYEEQNIRGIEAELTTGSNRPKQQRNDKGEKRNYVRNRFHIRGLYRATRNCAFSKGGWRQRWPFSHSGDTAKRPTARRRAKHCKYPRLGVGHRRTPKP